MAKAMLLEKPYSAENIECCLEYYFESQYPFGRDSVFHRTLPTTRDVPSSSSSAPILAPSSPVRTETDEQSVAPQLTLHRRSEQSRLSVQSSESEEPEEEEEEQPTSAPVEIQREIFGSFFRKFTGFFG
ncbi:hypothetical protein AAVH_12736 [Aphelenchoides avenae]|nr:hypothetical protein AAVH_12736 [Aphelenchus avenae]